jgi:hypothetical protein
MTNIELLKLENELLDLIEDIQNGLVSNSDIQGVISVILKKAYQLDK